MTTAEAKASYESITAEDFALAKSGDREAWTMIVEANERLAWSYAHGYSHRHKNLTLDDCFTGAMAGLAKAVIKYDPNRITKFGRPANFSTIAYYWMWHECQQRSAEDDYRSNAGVPLRMLAGRRGGCDEARSRRCVPIPDGLDVEAGGPDPGEEDRKELLRSVWSVVDGYSEPVSTVLRLYYRDGLEQREIGKRLGFSKQWIAQVLEKGIRSLKRDMARRAS